MILITAGAYTCSELQAEVGRLPPSFLPLANRRLYEHQVAALRAQFPHLPIVMSLPQDFSVPADDQARLADLGVDLVRVPEGLRLGESVLCAVNSIGRYDGSLRILHGDTLIRRCPMFEDVVGLADTHDDYAWEVVEDTACAERVWCGWFAFGDIKLLARSLSLARGDFAAAVRAYQAVRPQQAELVPDWLDLGHVSTYFRSRAALTTERAFNSLQIAGGVVRKTSRQSAKIAAEAAWYAALPPALKPLAPQLVQQGDAADGRFYELEYLPCMPLNELWVHGRLPPAFWSRIFKLARGLLDRLAAAGPAGAAAQAGVQADFEALVVGKTETRLTEFAATTTRDLDAPTRIDGRALPSLRRIAADCQRRSLALPARPGWLHGDLCFSNLLYDSRTASLKMIDPRGLDARARITPHGDLRYDAAKLLHSVLGGYDHVVAGRYRLQAEGPLAFRLALPADEATGVVQAWVRRHFRPLGLDADALMPLVVLLFLSMLPLHQDRPARQQALLANALRLYADLAGRADPADTADHADQVDQADHAVAAHLDTA